MTTSLENLSTETRTFAPPPELAADANARRTLRRRRPDAPAFWHGRRSGSRGEEMGSVIDWSNPPFAKWFIGGELNIAYNCVTAMSSGQG